MTDLETTSDEATDDYMPKAIGHKIIAMIEARPDTFDGTRIEKSEQTKTLEEHAMQVARVIDMGPDAYVDKTRFPSGAWCEIGNYVLLARYGGDKLSLAGRRSAVCKNLI